MIRVKAVVALLSEAAASVQVSIELSDSDDNIMTATEKSSVMAFEQAQSNQQKQQQGPAIP